MKTEQKETIKKIYQDMIEIAEVNNPDVYMMPKVFYNRLCKELEKLQLYSRRDKQSIANWRARAEKAEAELKASRMDKTHSNTNVQLKGKLQ